MRLRNDNLANKQQKILVEVRQKNWRPPKGTLSSCDSCVIALLDDGFSEGAGKCVHFGDIAMCQEPRNGDISCKRNANTLFAYIIIYWLERGDRSLRWSGGWTMCASVEYKASDKNHHLPCRSDVIRWWGGWWMWPVEREPTPEIEFASGYPRLLRIARVAPALWEMRVFDYNPASDR